MKRFFSWLAKIFRPQSTLAMDEDFLPGERARTKSTGVTAQQVAWRNVSAKVGDKSLGAKPKEFGDFERLLRKP